MTIIPSPASIRRKPAGRFDAMRLLILTIPLLFGLTFTACISDAITSSPDHTLTFSTDTVSFDTVFTGEGTPTARLLVYNRAAKGLNISSIAFANPQSAFQLNVDGVSGTTFSDVEIRAKDSIYVFIECYLPETADARPALTEDKLVFVTNGVRQEVQVEAYGQNVTRLRAVTLDSDTRFTAERPIVVFDSLVVAPGATLTVEPGTQLLFHDKASFMVRGRLVAEGEPGKLIDMRGDRLDNVLPDVGYDILAGQWDGLTFAQESFDNVMSYVDMRSTVRGLRVDSCGTLDRQKLTLTDCWIHNSQATAFSSVHARVDAYGCVFSEAAEAVVALTGGVHSFVQCTLANNYLFAAISQPLLSLYHLLPDDSAVIPDMPLMRASFENGIIYGLASDINVGDLEGSDVYMRNMLFRASGEDDEHLISCLWDTDPLFYTERADYYFNYRLRPDSPAIAAGNAAFVTPQCLIDIDGLNRLADGAPDLGAYVFEPPQSE